MFKTHTISFKNAFNGLVWSLRTQPNYRIHLFLSLISIIFGFYLKISSFEFLLIVFLITVGLAIETINVNPDIRLSISIGVATSSSVSSIEPLLIRADKALYEAKSKGRNQVVHADLLVLN